LKKHQLGMILAGSAAGAINGLFGAGGGMILVPLLTTRTDIPEDEIFPSSISIILPICLVSLVISAADKGLPWTQAFPYLIGSAVGGIVAGIWGKRIPTTWLHRVLGVLIIWGGLRYL
jgi:uncharacterized membrane protein YfcA